MSAKHAVVYVIDDDASVRHALARLVQSLGLDVRTFPSADSFLAAGCAAEHACVVADVRMPGMSGLQLQRELRKSGSQLRIVFVTAQDIEETRIEAIRAGGAAYLVKPVDDLALLDAVQWALSLSEEESRGTASG